MESDTALTLEAIMPGFVGYMSAERQFAAATVVKYRDSLRWFLRDMENPAISDIGVEDFISLKARMAERGVGVSSIKNVICALKCALRYARDVHGVRLKVELEKVKTPRVPRRHVTYLSDEELRQFIAAIELTSPLTDSPLVSRYCLRALVETLVATAMRLSEALSLDRDSVDFERREATIVGKGNRQRTVFFTRPAIEWIRRYVALRRDSAPALFATSTGRRLRTGSAEMMFRRLCRRAGMEKRVTPHILRHTAATNLLRNGCPIGFIKEILGHQRLETTCQFYLGVMSKQDTRRAFDAYTAATAPRDLDPPDPPAAWYPPGSAGAPDGQNPGDSPHVPPESGSAPWEAPGLPEQT